MTTLVMMEAALWNTGTHLPDNTLSQL